MNSKFRHNSPCWSAQRGADYWFNWQIIAGCSSGDHQLPTLLSCIGYLQGVDTGNLTFRVPAVVTIKHRSRRKPRTGAAIATNVRFYFYTNALAQNTRSHLRDREQNCRCFKILAAGLLNRYQSECQSLLRLNEELNAHSAPLFQWREKAGNQEQPRALKYAQLVQP